MNIEIDLIRHVNVAGDAALNGKTDVFPLAEDNSALLTVLVNKQRSKDKYQQVICSPLKRCALVAEKFASQFFLPLSIEEKLQEMNFGLYDGVPFTQLSYQEASASEESSNLSLNSYSDKTSKAQSQYEQGKLPWSILEDFYRDPINNHLPKAEQLLAFQERVLTCWQALIKQVFENWKQHHDSSEYLVDKKRILVLTHGGVIRMILSSILNLDIKNTSWQQNLLIDNATLTRIRITHYPEAENDTDKVNDALNKIHQQAITISMPLIDKV